MTNVSEGVEKKELWVGMYICTATIKNNMKFP